MAQMLDTNVSKAEKSIKLPRLDYDFFVECLCEKIVILSDH